MFHAVTWFNLAPKAMAIRVGGKRLPDLMIAAPNYVAWVVVSAALHGFFCEDKMSNAKRSNEPFLWLLFSAGGVVSAMLMPIHLLLFGLRFHWDGWRPPSYESLRALAAHPDHSRVSAGVLCSSAVPLGTPVPLYALRRLADQAPERTDQYLLLWRSIAGNSSGSLPRLENPLASPPCANRWLYTSPNGRADHGEVL